MAYSILQADIDKDKATLTQLWQRNLGPAPEGRFQWIYKNNPSGDPTSFLVQHAETGLAVGSFSLFPRTIFIHGKPVQALISGDLVVDQEHRAIGLAIDMAKSAISMADRNASGVLLAVPNEKSHGVGLKAGADILGDLCEMTQVLRTYSYIRRHIHFPLPARALSSLLDLGFRVRATAPFGTRKRKYSTEVGTGFNEKYDELWKKLSKKYSLVGERSSRFLEWRFHQSPYKEYKVFALGSSRNTSVLGYVIFCVDGKKAKIADIGFDGTEESFTEALSSFSLHQRAQGVESISLCIAGHAKLIHLLEQLGYSLRSRERKVLIYAPAALKAIIESVKTDHWFLTSADNDI
jgi:hypothetical protein